jgi:hypothetical protein
MFQLLCKGFVSARLLICRIKLLKRGDEGFWCETAAVLPEVSFSVRYLADDASLCKNMTIILCK